MQKINRPLCVDLDGTVTALDTLLIGATLLIRRNPFALFKMAYWLRRGRPYLKEQVFKHIMPDPKHIPYHQDFLAWLQQQKHQGRTIYLVTATNYRVAEKIANYLGFFDDIMASSVSFNLKSENKANALVEKFGAQGFDYAGNSRADFAVWKSAHKAIVVNPSFNPDKNRILIPNISEVFLSKETSILSLLAKQRALTEK